MGKKQKSNSQKFFAGGSGGYTGSKLCVIPWNGKINSKNVS